MEIMVLLPRISNINEATGEVAILSQNAIDIPDSIVMFDGANLKYLFESVFKTPCPITLAFTFEMVPFTRVPEYNPVALSNTVLPTTSAVSKGK